MNEPSGNGKPPEPTPVINQVLQFKALREHSVTSGKVARCLKFKLLSAGAKSISHTAICLKEREIQRNIWCNYRS